MRFTRTYRIVLALTLAACLAGGAVLVTRGLGAAARTTLTAFFQNSNGVYAGDDVMILGVPVGRISSIEPQPQRVKITFSVDSSYRLPADVKAAIISPALVSARAIQLTPAYSGGPVLGNGAVIPQDRTAVPVEFDDLRKQLEKLTEALQPSDPGGVSTLGEFVNTAADNLRGQGADIRDTLIQVSQVFSAFGDHSDDIFSTVRNLAALVQALQSSSDLLEGLNVNFAAVSKLLADDPSEVAHAVRDLNAVVQDAGAFVADNRDAIGTTSDKLTAVTNTLVESIPDIKQALHVAPTAFQNFVNIYEPANGAFTGALGVNQFSNPISFLCGAIQAASRLNSAQSSKLCVQYLAPIVKNRQYNFPPLGANFFVGAQARPNEVTFSEDWLRSQAEPGRVRDYYEGPLPSSPPAGEAPPPVEATPTDPAAGLPGLMVPQGAGS